MNPFPLTTTVSFTRSRAGSARTRQPDSVVAEPVGRVLRVSRLLAVAIQLEELLRRGVVEDYAEVARLGQVTRARITQIMNLTLLAPDIQEELLFWPRLTSGRDPFCLRHLLPITQTPDWNQQRKLWHRVKVTRKI